MGIKKDHTYYNHFEVVKKGRKNKMKDLCLNQE